jgi:hypothetical protein
LGISHWSLVIGHWSLVIGHWALVIGYWLLVIGYWLLGIGHKQLIFLFVVRWQLFFENWAKICYSLNQLNTQNS